MSRLKKALVVARIKAHEKEKSHTFDTRKRGPWDKKPKKADGGDVDKPAFDPSQPFQAADTPDTKPPFDPSQPFEPVPQPSSLQSAVRGLGQGLSFGFNDELRAIDEAGGAKPGEPGSLINTAVGAYKYWTGDKDAEKTYNEAVARERAKDESYKNAHPIAYDAGEIGGSLPSMAVLPEGEFANAGRFAPYLKGAQVGAEYGAASGAGEGTDATSRLAGGTEGAISGGVGGGVAPVLGDVAGAVYNRTLKPVVSMARGWIDSEGEAARRLSVALQSDQDLIASGKAEGMSPTDWVKARAAGEPVTLADLGATNTQALLRSAANTSPDARAVLEKVINDRFAGQSDRVADTVRGLVAGGANAYKTSDELLDAYNAGRTPLYKKAFSQPEAQSVWDENLEQMSQAPVVQNAIRMANITAKNEAAKLGLTPMKNSPFGFDADGRLKLQTRPDGSQVTPNLQYWDAVKKNLDKMGADGQAWAKVLRNHLDTIVPEYKDARGFASNYFGEDNALEAGRKLAGKQVDPEEITRAMANMKPDEKDLFREGYASDWAGRVIGNMRDSRDITKAMFNSPNERARALAVFGPAGMAKIQARMTLETIMDGARKAMGNSTTARQLIEAGLAGGALGGYLEGDWKGALTGAGAGVAGKKFLANELAAGARKFVGNVDATTARNVAELLTSSDPNKLSRGLQMATKNQKIADGLRGIANRVALAGQNNVTGPYRGPNLGPLQGPVPAGAQDKQQ